MILRGTVADLTLRNPLLRLRLRTTPAYSWENLGLGVSFLVGLTSQFYLSMIWFYTEWINSRLPAGFMPYQEGWGYDRQSMGELELFFYLLQWLAFLTLLPFGLMRLLREAVRVFGPSGAVYIRLPDEIRVVPLTPGQVLLALHDWDYLRYFLFVFCSVAPLLMPKRSLFVSYSTISEIAHLFWFHGISSTLERLFFGVAFCMLLFSAHRTLLAIRMGGLGVFRSALTLGWAHALPSLTFFIWTPRIQLSYRAWLLLFASLGYWIVVRTIWMIGKKVVGRRFSASVPVLWFRWFIWTLVIFVLFQCGVHSFELDQWWSEDEKDLFYLTLYSITILFACALLTPINLLDAPAKPQKPAAPAL